MRLLTLSILFATSAAAFAGGDGPCAADRQKFCAGVKPGGGAIIKCMKAHQADLSAACKAAHGSKHGAGAPPANPPAGGGTN